MSARCLLAGLQMVSTPRWQENLAIAEALVTQAAAAGAQFLVLPEFFPLISADERERWGRREVFGHGPIQDWLAATAVRHGVWLVAGSIPLEADDPGKIRNSCLVFSPAGNCIGRYDKIHLFGFNQGDEHYNEAAYIEAGTQPVAIDLPWGRVALSICYDLRFPELYRSLAPVDLILVPAAFTETTGRAHWQILLRARAIENQCYVLAVGQGGEHECGRVTHGHSMIVDPWGEILDLRERGNGIVLAEFDPERLRQIRQCLPALKHRQLS